MDLSKDKERQKDISHFIRDRKHNEKDRLRLSRKKGLRTKDQLIT